MGRLATHIAAKATHADNLPTKLPNVSLIDALLPRKVSSFGEDAKMPIDPNKSAPPSVIYTDIKKGKDGKLLMVRHKSSSIPGAPASVKDEASKDGAKKEDDKKDEKKDDKAEGKPEVQWTAEEDAKLKDLKTANTSWKKIAEEMGKPQGALKARWKEIEGKTEEPKKDEAGEKKDEPAASADFTAADDEKIKELLASNTGFKKIAQELGRSLDKALKDHINELKKAAGSEGDKTKDGPAPEKKDAGEKTGDFTAEEDAKIKELLAANTPYKQIATDLGRKLDKGLKDRIKMIKDESGEEAEKEEKKEEAPKEEKKNSPEKVSSHREKKKDEPKPASRPASAKAPSIARSHDSHRSHRSSNDPRFTPAEWRTLSEDEMFSFGELQLLIKLVSKDPEHNWLHIASAFMDKTGRRVHPEDIREKFMEVGIV